MKRSIKVGAVAFGAVVGMGLGASSALAGVNVPPVCTDDSHDITQGGAALASSVAPLCTDPDQGATLTYGLGGNAVASGVLDFDTVTGAFTYTPDPGFVGTDDFTYFADDGFVIPADDDVDAAETSNLATITINVAAQATTTTAPTTTTIAPTTATTATVLARTGVDNTSTAGGGLLAIGFGVALLAGSAALVTRARQT